MNDQELKAFEAAVDNCEVLRERLAKYEDSDGKALGVVVSEIAASFPRINLNSPEPLDPFVHCCEHAIYLDRERLHKLLEAAPKPADHNEDVRGALLWASQQLALMTSADGSGHADAAMAALRLAGTHEVEAAQMVSKWKSRRQWAAPEESGQ